MKLVTRIKIWSFCFFNFFFFLKLSSQITNEVPLIKCVCDSQIEYQIFKGDKLFIKLKSDNPKNLFKIDKEKIYTLRDVNNNSFHLINSNFKSKIYSQEKIYSIQRVEEKHKEKSRYASISWIISGVILLILGSLFSSKIVKNTFMLNDEFDELSCLYIMGIIITGILAITLILIGLTLKPSSKLNYNLIDKEIIFDDPKCKCEYYTLP